MQVNPANRQAFLFMLMLADAYMMLLEELNADEELDYFLARNPWVMQYDRRGNWVGAVAYENGWTA